MQVNPRGNLTKRLPATPCTPEMREAIVEVAEKRSTSVAEIQRAAFSLFLENNVSSTSTKESPAQNKEKAAS